LLYDNSAGGVLGWHIILMTIALAAELVNLSAR
jgi:hypothetical protein